MSSPRYRSAFLSIVFLIAGAANAAGVRQFSPQGQIDQQIRATAVFTSDMVPLGRPDSPAPFSVDCGEVKGRARWGDARTWSYTLERPLQPGERWLVLGNMGELGPDAAALHASIGRAARWQGIARLYAVGALAASAAEAFGADARVFADQAALVASLVAYLRTTASPPSLEATISEPSSPIARLATLSSPAPPNWRVQARVPVAPNFMT